MVSDSSATATILGAIIAAGVALVGLIVSKEQKTSEFRQAWIDGLRNDLAIYLSRINAAYDAKAAGFATGAELWRVVSQDVIAMNDSFSRIQLRLNDNEEPSQDLLNCMHEIGRRFCPDVQTEKPQDIDDLQKILIAKSRIVLKSEWKRVKLGELSYRLLKYFSIIVVLIALTLLLLNLLHFSAQGS